MGRDSVMNYREVFTYAATGASSYLPVVSNLSAGMRIWFSGMLAILLSVAAIAADISGKWKAEFALVNQKLLLQNEYLSAENRILRAHLPARMRLSDPERSTLAEIGKRLGRAALQQVACVAKPDTILAGGRDAASEHVHL